MNYFEQINEKLQPKLKGKELTLESTFKDLGIDSLDLVDLVFELEEELGVTFEDDEGVYNQEDAQGFIKLNALRLRLGAQIGRKGGTL